MGSQDFDAALLAAAMDVITAHGLRGLTLERLADAAKTSRMTLHRRGVVLADVVLSLSAQAAEELRTALFPVLTSTAPAADRLETALTALCDVADRHLPLLAGLFADDTGIFHGPPDDTGALPTLELFVSPFAKLLAEGTLDGTLRPHDDPLETATILFNSFGWGYVQLRHAQRWPAQRARSGLLSLTLSALRP